MTVIVALRDKEAVLLGADSAAVGPQGLRLRATRKVFRNGAYAVGFTTSWRMGQILRHRVDLPEPPSGLDDESLERFLVVEVIDTIRESFIAYGFATTARVNLSSDFTLEGQAMGGAFLIGVDGRIFEICEDYHVIRPTRTFAAVGAGAQVALAALAALDRFSDLSLEQRAHAALEIAEEHNQAVRGPFHFVRIPG